MNGALSSSLSEFSGSAKRYGNSASSQRTGPSIATGIRVEQQLRRVATHASGRVVRPVHAVSVALPGRDVARVAVPHPRRHLGRAAYASPCRRRRTGTARRAPPPRRRSRSWCRLRRRSRPAGMAYPARASGRLSVVRTRLRPLGAIRAAEPPRPQRDALPRADVRCGAVLGHSPALPTRPDAHAAFDSRRTSGATQVSLSTSPPGSRRTGSSHGNDGDAGGSCPGFVQILYGLFMGQRGSPPDRAGGLAAPAGAHRPASPRAVRRPDRRGGAGHDARSGGEEPR